MLQKNVVYCISCRTCQGSYVGQTSQCLKNRIVAHKSDSRLYPDRCALASHINTTKHSVDFDNVKILEKENNSSKRLFLEMCHIKKQENSINKKTDVDGLSIIYSYLLSIIKK